MTCPFYVAGRHPCALGEPDGRHCGPRQYPVGPCNLDEIGEWGAWRATVAPICQSFARLLEEPDQLIRDIAEVFLIFYSDELLDAVGWSP